MSDIQGDDQSALPSDCIAWGELQLRNIGLTDPIETTFVKRRAWSTVWKLKTSVGSFYLKEAAPGFAIEVPLLTVLCRWQPGSIVELVAADETRGWLLTRDAGRMLHDVMFDDPENGRAQLRLILRVYARLQLECLQRDTPLLAGMLEDRSPLAMAKSFAAVIADDALLRTGGATVDELSQRSHWRKRSDQLCNELAALKLPLTLEHGDLHISNIMISADGTPRIADWGDACWTTPLHGLVLCLDDVAGRHRIASHDAWFAQLIEEHFSVWLRGGIAFDFHAALAIVRALGPVAGVLQWSRGLDSMPAPARAIMAGHIVKRLRAFA